MQAMKHRRPRWSRPNKNKIPIHNHVHSHLSAVCVSSLPYPGICREPKPPSSPLADDRSVIPPRPACGLGDSRRRRVAAMSGSLVARSPADRFLDLATAGENTFLTGPAGSGKSHNVRDYLKRHPDTHVVASTGVAALNVGGMTVHRWAGMVGWGQLWQRQKQIYDS